VITSIDKYILVSLGFFFFFYKKIVREIYALYIGLRSERLLDWFNFSNRLFYFLIIVHMIYARAMSYFMVGSYSIQEVQYFC